MLFKAASGAGVDASIEAFDDTWTWGDSAKEALLDIAAGTNRPLQVMMSAMHAGIGEKFQGLKPKLQPLISPVKKASRVEVRASHQKGSQGALL